MNTTINNIDEFGRDTILRTPVSSFDTIRTKLLQGKSWAEITWEIEEEEEKEEIAALELERKTLEAQRKQKLMQLDSQRKSLLLKCEYQLEEGEIFE